ncbi:MAG: DUF2846 domain-containing protein [Saprospiraceae bacterium]
MNKISLFFILVLFNSCVSTTQFTKFSELEKPPSEMLAKICVVRPSIIASAIQMSVYCDENLIGKTGPKGYLSWEVQEGEHIVRTHAENKDYFNIYAKAGKTYYIKQSPKMGWLYSRVSLKEMQEKDGKTTVSKLKKPTLNFAE